MRRNVGGKNVVKEGPDIENPQAMSVQHEIKTVCGETSVRIRRQIVSFLAMFQRVKNSEGWSPVLWLDAV